jgi:hypothetical protein
MSAAGAWLAVGAWPAAEPDGAEHGRDSARLYRTR